jgi:hypothetical protein
LAVFLFAPIMLQCMSPLLADFVAEVGDYDREVIASIC